MGHQRPFPRSIKRRSAGHCVLNLLLVDWRSFRATSTLGSFAHGATTTAISHVLSVTCSYTCLTVLQGL